MISFERLYQKHMKQKEGQILKQISRFFSKDKFFFLFTLSGELNPEHFTIRVIITNHHIISIT